MITFATMKEQDSNSPIIHLQQQQLLLRMEYEYEKEEFKRQTENMGVARKVKRGLCWYPATPGRSYYNSLNQLVIEITHTENTDIEHNFEFGRPVCFFRQSADGKITYMNFTATVSYADETRMVAIMPGAGAVMEVQETDNLGVQLYFDETSYRTMFEALEDTLRSKGNRLAELRDILLGTSKAGFRELYPVRFPWLNSTQETAVNKVLCARDVAIVHGPPGTGKTTVITAILKRLNEIADPTGGMFGRDLVTAFQHDAVQNAIDRIEILGLPAIKFGHKYNESEDDIVEINAAIQGWINDRLSDLYTCHSDLDSKKYLTEFNKLYVDYLYSANSIDQTLDLLERVRDLVDIRVSSELLDELSDEISDLQLMTGRTAGATTNLLVRAVRRLPASEIAFEDNGRFEMQRAVYQLRKQRNTEFDTEIKQIQKMLDSEEYDFESLKLIRKKLLIKVLPKQDIFTAPNKKDDIVRLLGRISDYLLNQIEGGKDGEDLVIMQYMQSLEEDPLAVKQAILNYSAVNGATNQQVMRKEIADLKDGEIVFDNVLVDEAARSNPLDLFIPLSVAKDRIILVGDHRQLPHIIDEQIVVISITIFNDSSSK